MSKHSTRKNTPQGKRETIARRNVRAGKRTPDAMLTRSGHVRSTTR